MFKNMLLPTDGSRLSEQAIKEGIALAKEMKAKVTGFHAIPNFHHLIASDWDTNPFSQREYERIAGEQAKQYLAEIERTAKDADVPYEGVSTLSDAPSEAIIKTAQDKGCDVIFMASHGRRGIAGLLMGSETVKVLTHCKVPVLVYR